MSLDGLVGETVLSRAVPCGALLCLGMAFLTVFSTPAAGAGDPAGPEIAKEFAVNAMKKTAMANTFRLQASADVAEAVGQWGGPDFRKKWDAEVMPLFGGSENIEWHDFFSSAVIWIGCVEEKKAVIGFYNAWSDGLLLVLLDDGGKQPLFTDFRVVSGESWGGRSDAAPEQAVALYAGGEIVTVALARLYDQADQRFRTRYPAKGKAELMPKDVAAIVGATGEELVPIKARMLVRMQMYSDYFAEKNRRFLMAAGGLMKGFKEGDKARLLAGLSDDQSKSMVESAVALPAQIRQGLAPNFFGTGEGGAIVALVNPTAPRWVIVARMVGKKGSDRETDVAFEMFDLNSSAELLKLRKEESK